MSHSRRFAVLCCWLALAQALPAPAAPAPAPAPGSDAPLPADALPRADKLARALRYAARYLAPDAAAQIEALARPEALVPMTALLVGGVVAQEVPVVGEVFDVALVTWAAYALGWEAILAASDFVRFAKGAVLARSEADLDRAGQYFARFVARVGVDVAVAVLLHKTAQRLRTEIRESGAGSGGPGGGAPGAELAPVAAGADGAGRAGAAPRFRVHADGTIVALGALAAGVGIHRRDGEEDGAATGGGAAGAVEAGGAQGAGAGVGSSPAAPAGLSPRLLEIRQTLHDPRALAAFDRKFEEVGRNTAAMEHVVEGMRLGLKEGKTLEQRFLEEGNKRKPRPGAPLPPEVLAEIDAELGRMERIGREIERFAAAYPEVKGIQAWRNRLAEQAEPLDVIKKGPLEENTAGNIQAVRGPLTGLEATIETAWETERIVAVEREFWYQDPEIQKRRPVNVDVVADGGATWIESKASNPFGLGSSAWAECQRQALRQLEAARQNRIGGKPPHIVFRFSRGVSRAVASALEALGIEVHGTRVF